MCFVQSTPDFPIPMTLIRYVLIEQGESESDSESVSGDDFTENNEPITDQTEHEWYSHLRLERSVRQEIMANLIADYRHRVRTPTEPRQEPSSVFAGARPSEQDDRKEGGVFNGFGQWIRRNLRNVSDYVNSPNGCRVFLIIIIFVGVLTMLALIKVHMMLFTLYDRIEEYEGNPSFQLHHFRTQFRKMSDKMNQAQMTFQDGMADNTEHSGGIPPEPGFLIPYFRRTFEFIFG